MDRVSVVLASYNGATYLRDQLQSIVEQTQPPDEIIVSDDGSTDDTVAIAEDFLARNRKISSAVIKGPGTGYATNFWHGLQASTGDFVAWADQDDVWLPGKLEHLQSNLSIYAADLAMHSSQLVDAQLASLNRTHQSYSKTRRLGSLIGDPWFVPAGFLTMFKRDLVSGVEIRDRPISHQIMRPMGHDHVVNLLAFVRGTRIEDPAKLALHRIHDSNVAGVWMRGSGVGALPFALGVGAENYWALARATNSWADWVEGLSCSFHPGAVSHLRAAALRAEQRAQLYEGPQWKRRLRTYVENHRSGVYCPRERGGFGARGAAKDALGVLRK
jgi:glycosyltransferase involved in cell wall biosynthesis